MLLLTVSLAATAQTNFGVLVNSSGNFNTTDKALMAQQLGVPFVRENIILNQFNGTEKSFDIYETYGFKFLCNLNWMAGVNTFPNIAAYTAALEDVANSKYGNCPVYILQNEELNPSFNKFTAAQYVQMLQAAAGVMHPHGLKIANGGIYGTPMYQLTFKFLHDTYGVAVADEFALNAKLTTSQKKQALGTPTTKMKDMQTVIDGVKLYCDFINAHHYIDPKKGITSQAVWPQVKSYLEMYTGKPCITNETCIRNSDDSSYVIATVNTFKTTNTFYCSWFSGDSNMAGARSLFNPDKTIRTSGIAFTATTK